jgi:hypothetical protein
VHQDPFQLLLGHQNDDLGPDVDQLHHLLLLHVGHLKEGKYFIWKRSVFWGKARPILHLGNSNLSLSFKAKKVIVRPIICDEVEYRFY